MFFLNSLSKYLFIISDFYSSSYVIQTFNSKGAANLTIPSEIDNLMKLYVSKYRPTNTDCLYFFLTKDGGQCSSGVMCNALTSELQHGGVDKHVTPTK